MESIGLRVTRIDEDKKLADIVYRIQTICRLIFENTSSFKIFATQDNKIFRRAVAKDPIKISHDKLPDAANFKITCSKCGKKYKLYAKFVKNHKIDEDFKKKGFIPFPENNKFTCICGYTTDLTGIRNDLESQAGRKIIH